MAGVKHGVFVGTNIPYIWTLDLVCTMAWLPPEEVSCALISVKPLKSEPYSGDTDPIARGLEKLAVEHLLARELELPYFVSDQTQHPEELLVALELLSRSANLWGPEKDRSEQIQMAVNEFCSSAHLRPDSEAPEEWIARLERDYKLSHSEATVAVHHMLWHQYVDADLTQGLWMDRLIKPGGIAFQNRLRTQMQRDGRT